MDFCYRFTKVMERGFLTIAISLLPRTVSTHVSSLDTSVGQFPRIHAPQINHITSFSQQFEDPGARTAGRVINSQVSRQTMIPLGSTERHSGSGASFNPGGWGRTQ